MTPSERQDQDPRESSELERRLSQMSWLFPAPEVKARILQRIVAQRPDE